MGRKESKSRDILAKRRSVRSPLATSYHLQGPIIDRREVWCPARTALSLRPRRDLPKPYIARSIGIKHALVVDAQRGVLIFLARDAIAGDQQLDVGPHKAAKCVFRGADDRLAP